MERLITLLFAFVLISCHSTSPEELRLEIYALNAEIRTNLSQLDKDDWEAYDHTFSGINQTYLSNLDNFSANQRDLLEKEIGKYYALRSKWESKQLKGKLKGYLKEVEGFIEELSQ